MIVKNEEKVLARCLDCVQKFADEIIIVDTGSTDNTKKIALTYTQQVFDYKWRDDFSSARNFSFSLSKSDYIMWLDADDIIDETNCKKINKLKQELDTASPPDCIMAKYIVSPPPNEFYYYRERILRRVCGFVWEEPVHEVITPKGKTIYSDIEILHKKIETTPKKRNLKIYQKLIKLGRTLSPRAKYYYARELYYNGYYKKAIRAIDDFLNGSGWIENKLDACIIKSNCYKFLSNIEKAKEALVQSFALAPPRSKTICLLAEILIQQKQYSDATEWLKIALSLPRHKLGWIEPDFYTYRPYLDLSICYYYLNNLPLAKTYHNLAKNIHPNTPEILFNSQFFE